MKEDLPSIDYKKTLDSLFEGFQVISSDFRYIYINDTAAEQGKQPKEILIGQTMESRYPGIEKTEMFKKLKICIEKKEIQFLENEFNFEDGTSGWFELRMEPIPQGAIILSIDITRRKLAEKQTEELSELKEHFLQAVANQLLTPLSATRWSLEQLLAGKYGGLTERQTQGVKMAHHASKTVISRVSDLMTVMDIEENRITLEKQVVHIGNILRAALDEADSDFKVKDLSCEVNISDERLPSFRGDPIKIRELLDRLIVNAVSYSKDGGKITATISIVEPNKIRVEISDNGYGIPESEFPYVFNRFYRAPNVVNIHPEGAGVGLYIAKHFVELHNGEIGFTSKENQGSTFWVEIPTSL